MIQIYTGNGKGKTTAAIGQGIRAAGNGFKVIMVQFLKSGETGELNIIRNIDNFEIKRFEREKGFTCELNEEELDELRGEIKTAYNYIKKVIKNNECNMLIIDEIMAVLKNKFLSEEEVLELLNMSNEEMEIVLTGRDVPQVLVERADLVTEMKLIKHYYNKGIPARKGIEF